MRASLLINADPMKPLHPVMMTTSFSPIGVSNRTNRRLAQAIQSVLK
jgi:hypothetical protein